MNSRAQFEAAYAKRYPKSYLPSACPDGSYRAFDVQLAWDWWQAGIEHATQAVATSDLQEKALQTLESWANPSHATFNKEDAEFVLDVFRKMTKEEKK